MKTSSSACQPGETESTKQKCQKDGAARKQCILIVLCQCAAALFSSDRIGGGGEAQNCRLEKAVFTPPLVCPLPSPVRVCLLNTTPSLLSLTSLFLLLHAILLHMPKPMRLRRNFNRQKKKDLLLLHVAPDDTMSRARIDVGRGG